VINLDWKIAQKSLGKNLWSESKFKNVKNFFIKKFIKFSIFPSIFIIFLWGLQGKTNFIKN